MVDSEILRTAQHMILVFGLRARNEADAMRDTLALRNNPEGARSWGYIREAICELQIVLGRGERPAGWVSAMAD